MNWSDYSKTYDELFPKQEKPSAEVVETPTGTKEVQSEEIIDNPIETVTEEQETEEETEDNGDN